MQSTSQSHPLLRGLLLFAFSRPYRTALLIRINLCSRYVLLEMGRKDLVERVSEGAQNLGWNGGGLLWHSNIASPFLLTLFTAAGEQSPRGTRRSHARVSQDLRRAKVSSLLNSQSLLCERRCA